MRKTMFALADPVIGFAGLPINSPPDHTWVTTYQPVIECPPDESLGEYWYCAGDCHRAPTADGMGRMLRSAEGDVDFARRVGRPNDEGETCGINYGLTGVCHQIANRILYATKTSDRQPITVEGATGYNLSKTVYGAYGAKGALWRNERQEWNDLVDSWQSSGER